MQSKGKGGEEFTTIFFTKLLNRMRAKDLYQLFKEFGEIDEVAIPPKRDKKRKKYRFVKFLKVGMLEVWS